MSTKNILFDISSPDPVLQTQVFERLVALDVLQASPVLFRYKDIAWNRFLQYGQGHHAILETTREVHVSSNPIHLSNGLLSDFFIQMEYLGQLNHDSVATDAYRSLKKEVLNFIDIIHIHIRCKPGNDGRRMSLSLLQQTVEKQNDRERWIVFENPDIDMITKQILECMR